MKRRQSALPTPPSATRDFSVEGRAADHLRSPCGGGWAVCHCDKFGKFHRSGSHFRVGRMVMTPDEMLAFARRKGFQIFEVAA